VRWGVSKRKASVAELKALKNPPADVINCLQAALVLFGHYCGQWNEILKVLQS